MFAFLPRMAVAAAFVPAESIHMHRASASLRRLRRGCRPVLLAAMTLAWLSPPLEATPICRWVDGSGRTQISEVVPEPYKKFAICTDSQKYELSPEQRRAADQRQKDERARAMQETAEPIAGPASDSPRSTGKASQPGAKRPAEVVTDSSDCAAWWRH